MQCMRCIFWLIIFTNSIKCLDLAKVYSLTICKKGYNAKTFSKIWCIYVIEQHS